MIKTTFKALYSATVDAIKSLKEPLVLRSNQRAIDSAIDSAEKVKLDATVELSKLLEVVTKGEVINITAILEQRQLIKDADATIEELKEFKTEFFAEEE